MRSMLRVATFSACVVLFPCAVLAADTSPGSSDAVNALVRQALQAELAGGHRADLLLQAVALDPNCKQARWQLGYVRLGDEWVKVDDVPAHVADDAQLSAYRQKRDALVDTSENHRELARWCRKHNLPAEARLHWMKLLEYEQQDAEALAALGLRWHEGRLMTRKQIDQERTLAGERMAAMRRYHPQVRKWREAVLGPDKAKAEQAIAEIEKLDDPAALGAMEALFGNDGQGANRRLGQLLVETASRMVHPDATDVLLRCALDPESTCFVPACDALKKRPMFTYLPQLIAALPGTTKTKFSIYTMPGGTVIHEHEVEFDSLQGKQTVTYESSVTPSDLGVAQIVTPRALANEARKAQAIERQAAVQEAALRQRRERVQFALARTTGYENPEDPELWNERYAEYYGWSAPNDPKPEQRAYYSEYASFYAIPEAQSQQSSFQPNGEPGARAVPSNLRQRGFRNIRAFQGECFPAGTPVLTMDGARPIESIKPGDRVLSQDMESGELAYKTVQKRTLRPGVKMVRVHYGDKSLVSTFGHPFWVVGDGWHVAGHLQPGMQLRGLEADVTVDAIEPMPSQEVYNLLVTDFGTYFAGNERLLVHDDSSPQGTAALVPGLMADASRP